MLRKCCLSFRIPRMTVETKTEPNIESDRHKAEVRQRRAAEVSAQHEAAAAKQAERGKRGARERVLALLDEGTFQELDPFVQGRATQFGLDRNRPYGDGVVTGFGAVDGRRVGIFSQAFTIYGGSLCEAFAAEKA